MNSGNQINLILPGQLIKMLVLASFVISSCIGRTNSIPEPFESAIMPVISHAKRLRIESREGYSLLSVIDPWQGAGGVVHDWYLIPDTKPVPAHIDTTRVIRVPVKKIICMSTTHLAMISALGEAGSVAGFSGLRFLYSADLLEKAENGSIREIGYEDNLNKELILKLDPELVMVYGIGSESNSFIGKLKELGVKILYNADYLETDPLGKAEWIKMMGTLYSKELMADSIFRTIVMEYERIKTHIAKNANNRPKVLLGLPFRDTWYISPGNSYISELIEDAGGEYLWRNIESGFSMPMGLENVYIKALSADYWLNSGTAETKDQIIALDSRFARLPCFIKGNVYNNSKRVTPAGGNDYWEGGSLNPHIILMDIASILHPDLFSGNELFYYKQVK